MGVSTHTMMPKQYLDEDGKPEFIDIPDDYDEVMQEAHDHWENCNDTKDAYQHDDNMGLHTGGSLKEKYENYHAMALTCGEEPIGFDEWLNT